MNISISIQLEDADILKYLEHVKTVATILGTGEKTADIKTVVDQIAKDSKKAFTVRDDAAQPAPAQPAPAQPAPAPAATPEFEMLAEDELSLTSEAENDEFNGLNADQIIDKLKNAIRDYAKAGHKDQAKELMLKYKVPALSKINTLSEAEMREMYHELMEMQNA